MALSRPFYLTYRPNIQDTDNYNFYIHDHRNHPFPARQLIFKNSELIFEEFKTLFNYIEPCDANENCYSLSTYKLLLRCCNEVEAQFKRILFKNGYKTKENLKIREDYFKLAKTHLLSQYEVYIPMWDGSQKIRKPFSIWGDHNTYSPLKWYQAYNSTKHNIDKNFQMATFGYAIEALCGYLVLLSAQFFDNHFIQESRPFVIGSITTLEKISISDFTVQAIGAPLFIKLPNWSEADKYDFDWRSLSDDPNPYQTLFK